MAGYTLRHMGTVEGTSMMPGGSIGSVGLRTEPSGWKQHPLLPQPTASACGLSHHSRAAQHPVHFRLQQQLHAKACVQVLMCEALGLHIGALPACGASLPSPTCCCCGHPLSALRWCHGQVRGACAGLPLWQRPGEAATASQPPHSPCPLKGWPGCRGRWNALAAIMRLQCQEPASAGGAPA